MDFVIFLVEETTIVVVELTTELSVDFIFDFSSISTLVEDFDESGTISDGVLAGLRVLFGRVFCCSFSCEDGGESSIFVTSSSMTLK